MTSKRPLLIPHKRPLLPPTTQTTSNNKQVYKTLNPSATPATTYMQPPHLDNNNEEGDLNDEITKGHPPKLEYAFSSAPQPFLDPPTWEAMLKRAQERAASVGAGEGSSRNAQRRAGTLSEALETETLDQQRIRREREAEYGSMAIRGRSSVRGRGKRARAGGRGYWGGRV